MPLTHRDYLVAVSLVGMIGQEVMKWIPLNSELTCHFDTDLENQQQEYCRCVVWFMTDRYKMQLFEWHHFKDSL
jgi:hypothetical protein